jgi:hypothetical protein
LPSLLVDPIPELVSEVLVDPYDDPKNPPQDPEKLTGFCGMQWLNDTDPDSGLRKYRLADFATEDDVQAAGFHITHQGHCAGKVRLLETNTNILLVISDLLG